VSASRGVQSETLVGGVTGPGTRRLYLPEALLRLTAGQPALSAEAKEQLVARIQAVRPGAGLIFMIALGADAVAAELAGRHPNGA
jgi:hypothetical protein